MLHHKSSNSPQPSHKAGVDRFLAESSAVQTPFKSPEVNHWHKDEEGLQNQQMPGAAPSFGLEVARAYGMPREVIRFARLAPEVSFLK